MPRSREQVILRQIGVVIVIILIIVVVAIIITLIFLFVLFAITIPISGSFPISAVIF